MMKQESEFRSVLDNYPPDFCSFCERDTAFDGWGHRIETDEVEMFCDDCGHLKYILPWADVMPDLRAEVKFILGDMDKEE